MRKLFQNMAVLAAFVVLCGFSMQLRAQSVDLNAPFDADLFSKQEIRFLQYGFTLNEDYVGLIDGEWGPQSQNALDEFATGENDGHNSKSATNRDAAELARWTYRSWQSEGVPNNYFYFDNVGFALIVGDPAFRSSQTEIGTRRVYALGGSMPVDTFWQSKDEMMRSHDEVLKRNIASNPAYTLRRDDLWITSSELEGRKIQYIRSHPYDGGWGTLFVTGQVDNVDYQSIISSITDDMTAKLALNKNGYLGRLIQELDRVDPITTTVVNGTDSYEMPIATFRDEQDDDKPHQLVGPPTDSPREAEWLGIASYINDQGYMIGPAIHSPCDEILVDGIPAEIAYPEDTRFLSILRQHIDKPNSDYLQFDKFDWDVRERIVELGEHLNVLSHGNPNAVLNNFNYLDASVANLREDGGEDFGYVINSSLGLKNGGGLVYNDDQQFVGWIVTDPEMTDEEEIDSLKDRAFVVDPSLVLEFLKYQGIEAHERDKPETSTIGQTLENAKLFTKQVYCAYSQ